MTEMKVCRVCGQEKEDKHFYRIKGFLDYYRRRIIWCQNCQKMFLEMKRLEKNAKIIEAKNWQFEVSFL